MWSQGSNYLLINSEPGPRAVYPRFQSEERCVLCQLQQLSDAEHTHKYRVFLPQGYDENPLRRYPVVYMQDGQNLFFSEESASNTEWRIDETLALLVRMNALQPVIAVGVYPQDRTRDYTAPGYARYGQFLIETLKPIIDRDYRTRTTAEHTAVMGSSLGGVVSMFLAWEHPEVFGMAGCMSSTFGWRDDLYERVSLEPRRPVRL